MKNVIWVLSTCPLLALPKRSLFQLDRVTLWQRKTMNWFTALRSRHTVCRRAIYSAIGLTACRRACNLLRHLLVWSIHTSFRWAIYSAIGWWSKDSQPVDQLFIASLEGKINIFMTVGTISPVNQNSLIRRSCQPPLIDEPSLAPLAGSSDGSP